MKLTTVMLCLWFSVLFFLPLPHGVSATKSWTQSLLNAIKARDSVLEKLDGIKSSPVTSQKIEEFIDILKKIPKDLNGLDNLKDMTKTTNKNVITRKLINKPEHLAVMKYFINARLQDQYLNRGLGHILKTLKGFYDTLCLKRLLKKLSAGPRKYSKTIPVEDICRPILEDMESGGDDGLDISNICESVPACAAKETDTFSDPSGTSIKDACVEETNTCDVKKAIPMMTALLWYRTSNFIAQSYCSNLREDITVSKKTLENHSRLLQGYVSTMEWEIFKTKIIDERLYLDLGKSMAAVKERQKSAELAALACHELKDDEMCDINIMHGSYTMLAKLKTEKTNPGRVHDIRKNAKVAHGEQIKMRLDTMKHNEVLGAITTVNKNIFEISNSISDYFEDLAKFDEGIAGADDAYITGEIDKYEKSMTQVSAKMKDDIRVAMGYMMATVFAKLAEEVATMAAMMAENVNPLKVFFGGVDPGDLLEQAGVIATATKDIVVGTALRFALESLITDTYKIALGLQGNAGQISKLKKVVEGIKAGNLDSVSYDADLFLREYGAYTPKVTEAEVAKNDALWGAFKESTCDLLTSPEGIGPAAVQSIAEGQLLCEKLEGTIAEFTTLRQNIFDFQFDLVDTLAKVVRANIAKKRAGAIALKTQQLKTVDLIICLFTNQYQLQSEAASQCDRIAYREQGRRPTYCTSDFLTDEQIRSVITYDDKDLYNDITRYVFIPTRPEFPGDSGFISLPALARGDPVTFKLPRNSTWLVKHHWLVEGENDAPFVDTFKLFLPLKEYAGNTKRRLGSEITTRIKVQSIAGSSVSSNKDAVYLLPERNRNYVTVYKDSFTRCAGTRTPNPYSLCSNLPEICDSTNQVRGKSLLPTILSTWKVSYKVTSSDSKWHAPNPATPLYLIAKLTLRVYPDSAKRDLMLDDGLMSRGCCEDNKYRAFFETEKICVDCPGKPLDSESNLGGYYCELKDSQ